MIIEIDHDLDAQGNIIAKHVIDSNDPAVVAGLAALNAAPATMAAKGWAVKSKLAGEAVAITRWQRLVSIVNSPAGPANLKALNLL